MEKALGKKHWFKNYLTVLSDLFHQRNDLAHGTINYQVAFEPVYEQFDKI